MVKLPIIDFLERERKKKCNKESRVIKIKEEEKKKGRKWALMDYTALFPLLYRPSLFQDHIS